MLLTMVLDKHQIKAEAVSAGGIGSGLTMLGQGGLRGGAGRDQEWARE